MELKPLTRALTLHPCGMTCTAGAHNRRSPTWLTFVGILGRFLRELLHCSVHGRPLSCGRLGNFCQNGQLQICQVHLKGWGLGIFKALQVGRVPLYLDMWDKVLWVWIFNHFSCRGRAWSFFLRNARVTIDTPWSFVLKALFDSQAWHVKNLQISLMLELGL